MRSGGKDAVDVGPDFDAHRLQSRAHDRSGEIRTTASERGRDAIAGRAYETSEHRNLVVSEEGKHRVLEALVGLVPQRSRLRVRRVGDDAGAGIHPRGVYTTV